MNDIKPRIVAVLGRKEYVPANVPELLELLELPPARQQELQAVLSELEQSGRIARIKARCNGGLKMCCGQQQKPCLQFARRCRLLPGALVNVSCLLLHDSATAPHNQ